MSTARRPVAASQNRSSPSLPPATITEASGASAASIRVCESPRKLLRRRPVAASQSRTAPSDPVVRISCPPSATKRAAKTAPGVTTEPGEQPALLEIPQHGWGLLTFHRDRNQACPVRRWPQHLVRNGAATSISNALPSGPMTRTRLLASATNTRPSARIVAASIPADEAASRDRVIPIARDQNRTVRTAAD